VSNIEHEIDHVLEHRRIFECRVHRRRFDEMVGLRGDVGELQKPPDLLADLNLATLDALSRIDLVSPKVGHALDRDVLAEHVAAEQPSRAVHRIG
jgi:hypothetical protein